MTVSCSPTAYNNTVVRNRCNSTVSAASGAGICAYSGASISGSGNILYFNTATNNPQYTGSVNFTYSCSSQSLAGTGNITSDPLFVNNPPTGYFFLSQIDAGQGTNSPCVDAGHPSMPQVTGSTRSDMVQDGGMVDMGYHWTNEFGDAVMTFLLSEFAEESETSLDFIPAVSDLRAANYPNPFNPTTTIKLNVPFSGELNLVVVDISGRTIQTLHRGYISNGDYEFDFVGENLPSGVYFYRAEMEGMTTTGKMLLIK